MRKHTSSWLFVLTLLVTSAAFAQKTEVPPKDWEGSSDHPMVSRFAGAIITAYATKEFDELILPLGNYKGYHDGDLAKSLVKALAVEGKITQIAYAVPPGKSILEIFRNYEQALSRAGFKTLFTCARGRGCGAFLLTDLAAPLINKRRGYDKVLIDTLFASDDDVRHLTTSLTRASGDVYVTVTTGQKANQPPGVLVQVVETKAMQTGQVDVNAQAIAAALQSEGKIALYGILFDTDKATVKPESKPTLVEMAKFLTANPAVKVYIVGHTDNTGSVARNVELSQQRADAVVKALSTEHGIAAARLAAKGLASYAPVANNRDEMGRAKNRRVELVEQ
jgi:OOP family OmpA-OmpF porin